MLIDVRDDPETANGATCEGCWERIKYLQLQCHCCGEPIIWIDSKGRRHEELLPRTPAAEYIFSLYRIKAFASKKERENWEELEGELGTEAITQWVDWAKEKNIPGRRAVLTVIKCGRVYGRMDGGSKTQLELVEDPLRGADSEAHRAILDYLANQE